MELAIFANRMGGLVTPNTPPVVAFYLDQANRAQSVSARSAALVMYRAALENLLFEQGYQDRMCGRKLEALERAITEKKAAGHWYNVERDVLTVLKELGDYAVHPNDGDINKQATVDEGLLAAVRVSFEILLDKVYEQPHRDAERKNKLGAAVAKLKT